MAPMPKAAGVAAASECPGVVSSVASLRWKNGTVRAMLIFLVGLHLLMQKRALSRGRKIENAVDAAESTHLPPVGERSENRAMPNPLASSAIDLVESPGLPTYTREMASQAIRPVTWTCGDKHGYPISNEKTIFAFVHLYKTAGSTIREFFRHYSQSCRKSFLLLVNCTLVEPSTTRSNQDWNPCQVKEFWNGRTKRRERDSTKERRYLTVNNTVLKEDVDILGGHFRIGTGYSAPGSAGDIPATPTVRTIVFLRDPMSRFVSGILYEINEDHRDRGYRLEDVIQMIKDQVRGHRKKNEYWDRRSSLSYLLTPDQAEMFSEMTAEQIQTTLPSPEEHVAKTKALAAIQNLVHYNAIVGMTESMGQSMSVLRHAIVSDRFTSTKRKSYVDKLFGRFNGTGQVIQKNVSEKKKLGISTTSVLRELKKDVEFMPVFEEYLKYEQMITNFAWNMHRMQHEMTTEEERKKAAQ